MNHTRSGAPLSLVLLLSCGAACTSGGSDSDPAPHTDTGDSTGSDGGDSGGPVGGTVPTWDADQVEQTATEALAHGLAEPVTALDAFIDLLHALDEPVPGCPEPLDWTNPELSMAWDGNCVAGETAFGGGWDFSLVVTEADGATETWSRLVASFIISDDTQGTFQAGGEVEVTHTASAEGDETADLYLGGSFSFPGQDSWLGIECDVAVFGLATRSADGGSWTLTADGGMQLEDIGTISLVGLSWDSAVAEGRPTGVLRVRDPSGWWFDLDVAGAACSPLQWDGTDVGEVCLGDALAVAAATAVEAATAW